MYIYQFFLLFDGECFCCCCYCYCFFLLILFFHLAFTNAKLKRKSFTNKFSVGVCIIFFLSLSLLFIPLLLFSMLVYNNDVHRVLKIHFIVLLMYAIIYFYDLYSLFVVMCNPFIFLFFRVII